MVPVSNQKTVRLTLAQALVKYLQVQFTERDGKKQRLIPAIFGIFGHGNVSGISQALVEYGQGLPYYQPRNEQSMVHSAIGFAKASRRLSTFACTSSIGPGSTNMVTGAATATINRLPVLLLPSDYYLTRLQGPVLQQLEHPVSADLSVNDCFRPVSRYFDRITHPEQLLSSLPRAMRVLCDPVETGAVTLSLPQDLQTYACEYPAHLFEPRTWRVERRVPDQDCIREAVMLLKSSRRPAIVAGGGVHYSEAYEELLAFSETFGIPVGETFAGKGAVLTGSPLLLGGFGVTGNPAAGRILSQADLVICVGTRLTDFSTGSQSAFQHPEVKFLGLNVAAGDACKQGALALTADAREGLRALIDAARAAGVQPNTAYVQEIRQAKETWQQQLRGVLDQEFPGEAMSQGRLIQIFNQETQPGDTVVSAAGTPVGDVHQIWDVSNSASCHLEFGFSCMGYDIPAAIGVRIAQSSGEVYAFLGDGNFLMNPTELVTALQENLKITLVLSENHGFQSIHGHQRAHVGHSLGNEFRSRRTSSNSLDGDYLKIDFAQVVEGFGAKTWRAATPGSFRTALQAARLETGPCVIVVETEPMRRLPGSGIWWDIAAAEVTSDPVTRKLRVQYEEERKKFQRIYL